jgi:Ca2+-binding RTX toxin-like protein
VRGRGAWTNGDFERSAPASAPRSRCSRAPVTRSPQLHSSSTGTAARSSARRAPDTLVGTPGKDVICGLGGADRIDGVGGKDTLLGGAGNDLLEGSGGHDVLLGGRGADAFEAWDGTSDRIDGGPGLDRAWVDHTLDTVKHVERFG